MFGIIIIFWVLYTRVSQNINFSIFFKCKAGGTVDGHNKPWGEILVRLDLFFHVCHTLLWMTNFTKDFAQNYHFYQLFFVLFITFQRIHLFHKGSHQKKKTTKFWTLSEKGGGVSAAAKLFIDEKYGHVYRGGGGWSSSSKLVFCIKVCFVGTWTVFQFHNGMHASKQRNYRVTYQPTH